MKIFELSTNPFEAFIRKCSSFSGMTMPHIHESYELSLILSGNMGYMFKDYTTNTSKGSVILIKPFEIHKTLPTESAYERLLFHFSPNVFLDVFSQKITDDILSVFSSNYISLNDIDTQSVAETMMLSKNYLDEGKQEMAAIYLAKSLVYIHDKCIYHNEKKLKSDISKIMTYINGNISKVTIADICKKFYLSRESLNRLFAKELSITPHKYIEIVKINYSLELLKEGNLSIDEVAFFCGFDSSSYFSARFKKNIGQSPSEYRKMLSQNYVK